MCVCVAYRIEARFCLGGRDRTADAPETIVPWVSMSTYNIARQGGGEEREMEIDGEREKEREKEREVGEERERKGAGGRGLGGLT